MNTKYRLITDSGSDIPKELEIRYRIDIMPFSILIDGREYWEGIDLTSHQFYKLADLSPEIPKTNQITAERFEQKFLECAADGVTDAIVVLINSAGSQTYLNAVKAKTNLDDQNKLENINIHIIDSHAYSIGYGYAMVEAAKKLSAGKSVKSVLDYLEDWFASIYTYVVGFDLRHMKKSGRISAAASFMGEIMGLRPIIEMKNNETRVVQKVRGDKAVIDAAIEYISGIMVPETPWIFLRTTVTEYENAFIKGFLKKIGYKQAFESYSGCAVSSNAGTKILAVIVRGSK